MRRPRPVCRCRAAGRRARRGRKSVNVPRCPGVRPSNHVPPSSGIAAVSAPSLATWPRDQLRLILEQQDGVARITLVRLCGGPSGQCRSRRPDPPAVGQYEHWSVRSVLPTGPGGARAFHNSGPSTTQFSRSTRDSLRAVGTTGRSHAKPTSRYVRYQGSFLATCERRTLVFGRRPRLCLAGPCRHMIDQVDSASDPTSVID